MKAEELAMIINEIDEDMVEDAWTENGISIIISERSPLSFWKIAAATAACFAAVIAGVFCFAEIKPDNITPPNDSTYTSENSKPINSESESAVSTDSESSDTEDESHSYEQSLLESMSLPKEGEDNRIVIDETHTDTIFYAEKFNDRSYVQLNIEETNASVNSPVYITVYDAGVLFTDRNANLTSNINRISKTLIITEPGGFAIEYTRDRGAGSIACLYIECSDYDGLILNGNWIP